MRDCVCPCTRRNEEGRVRVIAHAPAHWRPPVSSLSVPSACFDHSYGHRRSFAILRHWLAVLPVTPLTGRLVPLERRHGLDVSHRCPCVGFLHEPQFDTRPILCFLELVDSYIIVIIISNLPGPSCSTQARRAVRLTRVVHQANWLSSSNVHTVQPGQTVLQSRLSTSL